MSYTINHYNGTSLVSGGLADGTINNTATSLTLVGRDYAGYGQFINENFVYLLENFASANSGGPSNPIAGQLWWDTTNNILKVYSGTSWKISTGATSQPYSNPPGDLSALGGDLWFDTTNQQLKVYSGTSWVVVGPQASSALQTTGSFAQTVTDTGGGSHPVILMQISGITYAIISKDTFSSALTGFSTIKAGINFNTTSGLVMSTQDSNATPNTLVQRDAGGGITGTTLQGTALSIVGSASVTNSVTAPSFIGSLTGNVSATNVAATGITASGITASTGFSGPILTPTQTNITSVGTLTGLVVNGVTTLTGAAYLNGQQIATANNTVAFTSINNTVIGNVSPSTAAFTAVNMSGNITPTVTGVISIGTPSLQFGSVNAVTVTGSSLVQGSVGTFGTINVGASMMPFANATVSLGTTSNWFNNGFFTTLSAPTITALSGTVAGGTITATGTVSGTTGTFTTVNAGTLSSSGGGTFSGNVAGSYGLFTGVVAPGTSTLGTLVATGVNASGISVQNAVTATSVIATSGTIATLGATTLTATTANVTNVTASSTVTGVTGAFTTVNATTVNATNISATSGITGATGSFPTLGTTTLTATTINAGTINASTVFNGAGTGLTGFATSLGHGGAHPAGTLTGPTLASAVVYSSLTSVGTVTSGTWSSGFGAVSGANLTNLSAGNLTGTIPSTVLGNSALYIGTTSIPLNRGGGGISLTGVSIDGNAGSASSVAWGNISGIPSIAYNNGGTYGINITGNAGSASSVAWANISGVPTLVYNNSGTYSINITGSAGSASSASTAGYASNASNLQVNGSSSYWTGATGATADTIAARDGSGNLSANFYYGTAQYAQYADLAERYASDAQYAPGTLLKIGGVSEVTVETDALSDDSFGVVSTNPGYAMNNAAGDDTTHPYIALAGRVPVRVVGPVTKGQRLVSAGNGCVRAAVAGEVTAFNVIGRALESNASADEKLVEAVVKFNV
jgi:hypothetical protein